ncbi:hypothetical protein EDD16DRAFT_1636769, partial [Pisolithus croceorrhizus]
MARPWIRFKTVSLMFTLLNAMVLQPDIQRRAQSRPCCPSIVQRGWSKGQRAEHLPLVSVETLVFRIEESGSSS